MNIFEVFASAEKLQKKVENTSERDCHQYSPGGYLTYSYPGCRTEIISLNSCEGFKIISTGKSFHVLGLPAYKDHSECYITENTKRKIVEFCESNGFKRIPFGSDANMIYCKQEPREIRASPTGEFYVVFESGNNISA